MSQDSGFTSLGSGRQSRSINKDGTFNVVKNSDRSLAKDLFYYFISISSLNFTLLLILFYTLINLLFGLIYYWMGVNHFTLPPDESELTNFLNCLFFSFQTFGTIGYGYISPITVLANTVVVFEIFLGMSSIAILTGLIYSRFSSPRPRILFSNNVIFHENDPDYTTLKFKVVNKRDSIMTDTEARVILATRSNERPGLFDYNELKLQVNKILFFPLTWTIVHVIDENSPLFKLKKEELEELNPEILISVRGFDDKFQNLVHARFSYLLSDWEWNKKFARNFDVNENGHFELNVNDIHDFE